MNARARKRCISQRFYGRFYFSFIWRSTDDHAWDNIAPVGREFGSKDYERLSILDMYTCGTITESRAMELLNVDRAALLAMLARDGLSVEIEKAALENPEFPLQFVRDIVVSLEEVNSGQVLAYELDDGRSASTQGGVKS